MDDKTKRYRPDTTGLRNADKRAQLGDFVAHPEAVASRPGRRLESDPYYKATQAGFRQPEPGLSRSQLPNILSPHHRIDVMGSQPYFEGSTDVQRLQRFEDLAVGDLFPGNDPDNYIGLFDGVKSDKAGVKTGIYSDDHNIAHIDMDETRRKMNLTTAGGSKASVSLSTKISELPEDVKTALIADLSLRDELSFNRILQDRVNMAQQAFPNASYNEIKEMLLKDPKGIANLYKTETGALATRLHPKFSQGTVKLSAGAKFRAAGVGSAAGFITSEEAMTKLREGDYAGAFQAAGTEMVVGEAITQGAQRILPKLGNVGRVVAPVARAVGPAAMASTPLQAITKGTDSDKIIAAQQRGGKLSFGLGGVKFTLPELGITEALGGMYEAFMNQ